MFVQLFFHPSVLFADLQVANIAVGCFERIGFAAIGSPEACSIVKGLIFVLPMIVLQLLVNPPHLAHVIRIASCFPPDVLFVLHNLVLDSIVGFPELV